MKAKMKKMLVALSLMTGAVGVGAIVGSMDASLEVVGTILEKVAAR